MLPRKAERRRLLDLLAAEGGVTEASVRRVSEATGVPAAEVWGTGLFYSLLRSPGATHRVCTGLTCRLEGAEALLDELRQAGKHCEPVSCLAQCDRAPVALDPELELVPADSKPRGVSPDDPALPMNLGGADDAAYAALARCRESKAERILDEIEASGLQGRGGAGFPAHIKWRAVRDQRETERYVVCNADEGEPGTFKDREVMLRRPHRMIEGLAIAAETVGAAEVLIYIRGEFKGERRVLERALAEAGPRIRPLRLTIVSGQGAYICGEETALLESLEGKRGMPRLKPPYPTESGYLGKPTLMHNVETAACVPYIVLNGGRSFRATGREEAGSKLYCVSGHVKRPGVYELPLGVTLDELVDAAGGYEGTPRAFSPGGASSGFLPMSQRGLRLDYKSLEGAGSMLGSAGVVVLNDTVDMARAALWQLEFFAEESCGQCAPCRIGSHFLKRQVESYLEGGDPAVLRDCADVGWEMEQGSICGLGMVAAKPLDHAREHFAAAFEPRPASCDSPTDRRGNRE